MKGFLKFLRLFLCTILSILMCGLIIVTHIIFDSSQFLKKEYIINALKDVEFIEPDTTNNNSVKNNEIREVFDSVYLEANKIGVSSEDVDKFINSDEVKEFMGSYMGTITNYLATGEDTTITKEELRKLTEHSVDDLVMNSEYKIDTETRKQIVEIIDEQSDEIINSLPKPSQMVNDIDPDALKTINFIFSTELKVILIGSIIFITGLIALLLWHPYHFIKWFSISNIIASILIIGLSFIISPIITWALEGEVSVFFDIMMSFINQFETSMLISGSSGIVISIILLIIYKLFKKHEKEV